MLYLGTNPYQRAVKMTLFFSTLFLVCMCVCQEERLQTQLDKDLKNQDCSPLKYKQKAITGPEKHASMSIKSLTNQFNGSLHVHCKHSGRTEIKLQVHQT